MRLVHFGRDGRRVVWLTGGRGRAGSERNAATHTGGVGGGAATQGQGTSEADGRWRAPRGGEGAIRRGGGGIARSPSKVEGPSSDDGGVGGTPRGTGGGGGRTRARSGRAGGTGRGRRARKRKASAAAKAEGRGRARGRSRKRGQQRGWSRRRGQRRSGGRGGSSRAGCHTLPAVLRKGSGAEVTAAVATNSTVTARLSRVHNGGGEGEGPLTRRGCGSRPTGGPERRSRPRGAAAALSQEGGVGGGGSSGGRDQVSNGALAQITGGPAGARDGAGGGGGRCHGGGGRGGSGDSRGEARGGSGSS